MLVLSAEDHSGMSPNAEPGAGPSYLSTYLDAPADAGIPADVYDIDANGRHHAVLDGGVLARQPGDQRGRVSALTIVGQSPFSGSFSLTGQAFLPRFTPTSAVLPAA